MTSLFAIPSSDPALLAKARQTAQTFADPLRMEGVVGIVFLGAVARLIAEKVPLRAEERKWLVMSGLTLSEWYINRLTQLWVERGSLISAHHMVDQGLLYFYDLLFGLNDTLVADMKWRLYCAAQLERLPERFAERIQEVMLLRAFTVDELHRRRGAFLGLWEEMKPAAEAAAGMSFAEMLEVV